MFPITIIDLVLWTVLAFLCRFYLHLENVVGIAFEGAFRNNKSQVWNFFDHHPQCTEVALEISIHGVKTQLKTM